MTSLPQNTDINADISGQTLAAGILGIVLSALFFAGRAASRWLTKQKFDASDYTLLLGMICGWGICAMMIYGSTQGLGRHIAAVAQTDPTLSGPRRIMRGLIATECLYVVSLGSIKISFLLLYRRLFPGKGFRTFTNILGGVIIAWATSIFFLSIFSCSPIYAFWTFEILATAKCINTVRFYIGIWVPNITTDLIILFLPQTKIWKLQVSLRARIGLAFMFLLGSFVMVASVIRFTTLFQVDLTDATWTITTLGVWTCVELMVAVASASMPVMRPLLHAVLPQQWRQRTTHGSGSGSKPIYNLGARPPRSGEGFERLKYEDGGSATTTHQSYALAAVKEERETGRRDAGGVLVTKTWSTRSGEGDEV
ncbi:hypothetical protein MMC30_003658 [Trapelia coarctata]|nr:hypothetical protein [Trapelia coarctata]